MIKYCLDRWNKNQQVLREELEKSPMVGGQPAGVSSNVLGIVEFPDGVERVYPTSIKFCDKENADLAVMQKAMEERDKDG